MTRSRREFPSPVKRAAYARSRGVCECHLVPQLPTYRTGCGRPLGDGNTYYEHIICDGIGGDPTLDNCAVLTRTCWRIKTDTYDLPIVAKTKRTRDLAIGIKDRWRQRLPGGRDSAIKIKINGPTVWRDSGRPIGRSRE